MRLNAPKPLIEVLLGIYPRAAMCRDREGCENTELLDLLLDAYPDSIDKRDGKKRKLAQIITERDCLVGAETTQEFMDVLHHRMKQRSAVTYERAEMYKSPTPKKVKIQQMNVSCERSNRRDHNYEMEPESPYFKEIQFRNDRDENIHESPNHKRVMQPHTKSNCETSSRHSNKREMEKKSSQSKNPQFEFDKGANNDHVSRGKMKNLEQKLEDSTVERDVLRDKVAALNKENKKLKDKVKKLASNVSKSTKENDESKSVVSTLETDLSAAKEKISHDRNIISKLQARIEK
eukprot:9485068-Ditylum_brightwellii.AAC.1